MGAPDQLPTDHGAQDLVASKGEAHQICTCSPKSGGVDLGRAEDLHKCTVDSSGMGQNLMDGPAIGIGQ